MLSSTASALLRLGGWSYLPDFATRKLLALYHHLLRSHGITVPQPGTPHWQKHYRVAFALSVLTFLSYNLVEAARDTPPNFFQILGVTPQVDDIALKTAYRTFAKRYHPDRAGPASESLFIEVRDAYDALKNPVKRFAYERFGPDSLKWRDCSTPREFLQRGLSQASGFYIGSGAILVGMSAVMKPSPVAFWRYILLFGLFASELCLTVGYQSAGILGYIFSDRVGFQHILFLHHLFVFLSIALSRVVPVLFPDLPSIRPEDSRTYAPFLEHLNTLAKAADGEVSRLLHLELHSMSSDPDTATAIFGDIKPCQPSITVLDTLTREMEDIVVEQQVRAEPPLRALWDCGSATEDGE
ncbi:hypothetical protein DFH11DRAFT_96980 [Phellopilus nigrolimitatus]|nr:hypothetical protein DFH11DRAFT_96980 [Phellopilus nigrolimitatus]